MQVSWWVPIISAVVTGIVCYIIPTVIAPKLALNRELAAEYLAPFREWCSNLYGELYEFEERYAKDRIDASPVLIIMDFRELHDTLRYASRWAGKIKKKKKKAAEYLQDLMNSVDEVWHRLQNDYSVNFDTCDNWIQEIISCPEKDQIGAEIKGHINSDLKQKFQDKRFRKLMKYLEKQIPKG